MGLGLTLAIISGFVSIFSKMFNYKITEELGLLCGTIVNYITASLISVILIVFSGSTNLINMKLLSGVPKLYFIGGVFGVIALVITNIIIPKLPVAYSTIIILTGQLGAGMVIDSIMSGKFQISKALGIMFVIAGIAIDKAVVKREEDKSQIA